MPRLINHSEKFGCGATIGLDSGETCIISIAQTGVLIRGHKQGIIAALVGSFLGPKLYQEKDVYKAAAMAMTLDTLYPDYQVPIRFQNPVLGAFANAVWQCSTAAQVSVVLHTVGEKVKGAGALPVNGERPSFGDGASPGTAIFIEARHSLEGIPKEYAALEARFGKRGIDWKVVERFLVEPGDGRVLEKFILSVRGRREIIYFDISGFVHSDGPEEEVRLARVIAKHDRELTILLPKDRAMFLLEIVLKLTEDQLEQLGWSIEVKNGLVDSLLDALKPFHGIDYADIPPSYVVEMLLSQWSRIHAFLRMCEPRDIEQEEELEDLKAFIGGAVETAQQGT